MTPDLWQQIKDTFHAALERAPSERAAFLEKVCAGDDLLRREIESLIQAYEQTGKFVDAPLTKNWLTWRLMVRGWGTQTNDVVKFRNFK